MDEELQEARDYTFHLLSYRERSKAEVEERLTRKGYREPVISQVIERLSQLDFLNDRRFAEKWVLSRLKYKPRGRYLIIKELQQKGIDRVIVQDVLAEMLSREQELAMGERLAAKWLNSHYRTEYNTGHSSGQYNTGDYNSGHSNGMYSTGHTSGDSKKADTQCPGTDISRTDSSGDDDWRGEGNLKLKKYLQQKGFSVDLIREIVSSCFR